MYKNANKGLHVCIRIISLSCRNIMISYLIIPNEPFICYTPEMEDCLEWLFLATGSFRGYQHFYHWQWSLFYYFNILTLLVTFETLSANIFIFQMNFPWYNLVLNPLILTSDLLKKHFYIVFLSEKWMLEFSYCIWSFFVKRSFYWFPDSCSFDLGYLWNEPLLGASMFHKHTFLRNIQYFVLQSTHLWPVHSILVEKLSPHPISSHFQQLSEIWLTKKNALN